MIDLAAWPGLRVLGPLDGGHRTEVREVRAADGTRFVARRSTRAPAALAWELDLMDALAGHGFVVPEAVRAADGRRCDDGVVVQTWVDGGPPAPDDRSRVADELRRLHRVTTGWAQRPGFLATRDLLTATRGGDVDLTRMPRDVVDECRAAWRGLAGTPLAVVHGDPGPSNVRLAGGRVGLIDWDEARVDHVDLDLGDLPDPPLPPGRRHRALLAVHAWEVAAGWAAEPDEARLRLGRLRSDDNGE